MPELAHRITQDRETHQTALHFHHIGETSPLFDGSVSSSEQQAARRRWQSLENAAHRHECLLTVKHYQEAIHAQNTFDAGRIASTIMKDARAHFGATLEACNNHALEASTLRQQIRSDAEHYEWNTLIAPLTPKERMICTAVKDYVDAKRAHGQAWRDILQARDGETMDLADIDKPTFVNRMSAYSKPFTAARNKLAAGIAENRALYIEALEHFNIKPDELNKEAYAHHCKMNIVHYMQATTTRLEKASLATDILKNPKAHHSFIIDATAQQAPSEIKALWTSIRQDANILERKHYFANLTPQERTLQRAIDRYKAIHQQLGKAYAAVKDIPYATRPQKINQHLNRLFTQRNQLAYQFIEKASQVDALLVNMLINDNRVALNKMQKQHDNHIATLIAASAKTEHKANTQTNQVTRIQEQATVSQSANESIYPQPPKPSRPQIDIARLKQDLNAQAENIALYYLGQPKKRQGIQWRYGTNKGSQFVTVSGPKQGLWKDFQTGVGGDMLKLIQLTTGRDFKESLIEAMNFLGGESRYLSDSAPSNEQLAERQKRQLEAERIAQAEHFTKMEHVKTIASGTQSIQGTLAERYLREHRAIQGPINSDNLRFHPALKNWATGDVLPALVVLAHDVDNNLCGLQATFLNPATAAKADIGHAVKLSRGTIAQGSIVHEAIGSKNSADVDKSRPIVALAEGLETALSVAEAHPDWQVRLTFGVSNFERAAITALHDEVNVVDVDRMQPKQSIVICADNDGVDSGTAKAVKKAIKNLATKNITAYVVEPQKPEHIEKWDFNDALKIHGVEIVRVGMNTHLPEFMIKNDYSEHAVYMPSQKIDSTKTNEKASPIEKSLASLFIDYCEMEQKQKELVFAHYEARDSSDHDLAVNAKNTLMQHDLQLKTMARELSLRDDVQALILDARQQGYYTDKVDFEAMKADLFSGDVNLETIHPLLKALRQKVSNIGISRQQSRGRRR